MSIQPKDMNRVLLAGKLLATVVNKQILNGEHGEDPKALIKACSVFGCRPYPGDKPSLYEKASAWLRTKLQKT